MLIGMPSSPTSPMSWYSGSHDTITSSSRSSSAAAAMASRLAPKHPVREHHALGLGGRPARELQDDEPLGVVGRDAPALRRRGCPAPAAPTSSGSDRRVAGHRLEERGQLVVDQQELGVAVADAGPGRLDELLDRAQPHRQRQHHDVAPASQHPWMAVTSARLVGPRRATWSPGAMPRAWRVAPTARASSWSCAQVTKSPSAPATEIDEPDARGAAAARSSRLTMGVGDDVVANPLGPVPSRYPPRP